MSHTLCRAVAINQWSRAVLRQVETDAEEMDLQCTEEREAHAAAATGLRSQV